MRSKQGRALIQVSSSVHPSWSLLPNQVDRYKRQIPPILSGRSKGPLGHSSQRWKRRRRKRGRKKEKIIATIDFPRLQKRIYYGDRKNRCFQGFCPFSCGHFCDFFAFHLQNHSSVCSVWVSKFVSFSSSFWLGNALFCCRKGEGKEKKQQWLLETGEKGEGKEEKKATCSFFSENKYI